MFYLFNIITLVYILLLFMIKIKVKILLVTYTLQKHLFFVTWLLEKMTLVF